jgi:hypothetical protein
VYIYIKKEMKDKIKGETREIKSDGLGKDQALLGLIWPRLNCGVRAMVR